MKFYQQETQVLHKTQYLWLKCIHFSFQRNMNGPLKEGKWFFVERENTQQAVVIIPFIRETQEVILIKQFRIPFWNYVIEFPAGLIEDKEDISVAALRELKEETGYNGKIVYKTPPLAVSAGMTNEMASYCLVEVDLQSLEKQNLDPVEDIEVLLIKRENLTNFLQKSIEQDDIVDCKVYLSSNLLDYFQEV